MNDAGPDKKFNIVSSLIRPWIESGVGLHDRGDASRADGPIFEGLGIQVAGWRNSSCAGL